MPTQKERNAETLRRLLTAARELFAEKGYAGVSVADIVKRAGRSHGSFYLHFANKEAVLKALLVDVMTRLSADGRTMWEWDAPGASVRRTVHRYIEDFGENRDLWLLLDERSSLEPAFQTMNDQWFEQLADSITHGIVATETPGLAAALEPDVMAHVFAAMLVDSTRAFYQEQNSWTIDELADEISRLWALTLGYDYPAG